MEKETKKNINNKKDREKSYINAKKEIIKALENTTEQECLSLLFCIQKDQPKNNYSTNIIAFGNKDYLMSGILRIAQKLKQ